MAIEAIKHDVALSDELATGGQPSEEHIQELAQAGFELVINLGLLDPRYGQATLGWSSAHAAAPVRRLWEPNEMWAAFIESSRQALGVSRSPQA